MVRQFVRDLVRRFVRELVTKFASEFLRPFITREFVKRAGRPRGFVKRIGDHT